jgi:nicotinate-nucleotide adenylyltransferase
MNQAALRSAMRRRSRQARYDEAMNQPDSADRSRPSGQVWQSGSRVAFFGGSFDPPHLGHLAVARAARDAFRLDAVLFAPVGAQPLKREGSTASFEHRLEMTRLAIAGERGFAVSLADAPRPLGGSESPRLPPNYTIDTLVGLRAALQPGFALYCLMGADSFFGLRRWHRAAEIPFVAPLIVAWRPGQPLEGLKAALPQGLALEPAAEGDRNESGIEVRAFCLVNPARAHVPFYVLPGLDVEISATEIREAIRKAVHVESSVAQAGSAAVQTMLPAAVAEYIRAHGLYR